MLTPDNTHGATTARTRLVTHPNGGTRVLVTVNGHTKRMPFDHGARDAHVAALAEAMGISESRLVEVSRTLDGRAWHIEPATNEAYENGVDTYEVLAARHGEDYGAHATLDMLEGEDTRALKLEYNRLTKGTFSRRDAFLTVLASVTSDGVEL